MLSYSISHPTTVRSPMANLTSCFIVGLVFVGGATDPAVEDEGAEGTVVTVICEIMGAEVRLLGKTETVICECVDCAAV